MDFTKPTQNDLSHLESLINNLPGVSFRYSIEENTIDYVSNQCHEILGKSSNELYKEPKNNIFQNIATIEQVQVELLIEQAIANQTKFHIEFQTENHEGKTKWFSIQGSATTNPSYKKYIEGYLEDITSRKKRESILTNSRSFYKKMNAYLDEKLDHQKTSLEEKILSLDVVYREIDKVFLVTTTDIDGYIIDANDMFCQSSGYHLEELIGENINIMTSEYHTSGFFSELWKTISNGDIWRGEIQNKSKQGELFWVDVIIVPFLNKNKKPFQYFSVSTLISDRKKAEQELQEKTLEIEKNNITLEQQKQKDSKAIVKDGMEMSFVRIDHREQIISYSGAKSPLVIERDGELIEHKPTRQAIGCYETDQIKEYKSEIIEYKKGDKLYLLMVTPINLEETKVKNSISNAFSIYSNHVHTKKWMPSKNTSILNMFLGKIIMIK